MATVLTTRSMGPITQMGLIGEVVATGQTPSKSRPIAPTSTPVHTRSEHCSNDGNVPHGDGDNKDDDERDKRES